MYAISKKNKEIVELLVNKGADVDKEDRNGNATSIYADKEGTPEIIEFLKSKYKPFKCTFEGCSKSFNQPSDLKLHERIHTEEKPFKCTFEGCGKSFNRPGDLNAHERTHREEPFKCTFEGCGQSFTRDRYYNFIRHYRIHTGEKPFKCTFEGCNYAANQSSSVKRHYVNNHEQAHKKRKRKRDEISDERKSYEDDKILEEPIDSIRNEEIELEWFEEEENIFENSTSPPSNTYNFELELAKLLEDKDYEAELAKLLEEEDSKKIEEWLNIEKDTEIDGKKRSKKRSKKHIYYK